MDPSVPRPMKSSEWVLSDLKKQWIEGHLKQGDKLASVEELAMRYQVGRSTIREALSALKVLGMLNMKQGEGTYVRAYIEPASPEHPGIRYKQSWVNRVQSLRHILEVRRVLETGCARLAAMHRTDDDLACLTLTLADMQAHLDNESISEQADVRYHLQIAQATHNPVLIELMTSLSQKLHDSMSDSRALWFYAERSSSERLYQEHLSIYQAIAHCAADEAATWMDSHLAKVEQVLNQQDLHADDKV
jgi:GntR family transcriptional repressor for pyruvate dehydrogenase complex